MSCANPVKDLTMTKQHDQFILEQSWRDPAALWRRFEEFADDHPDEGFRVLAGPETQCSRWPLIVIVHPGDAVQKPDDVIHCAAEDAAAILAYSTECQAGMAQEALALFDRGADVVILHRASSGYAFIGSAGVDHRYVGLLELAHQAGAAVLYGDHLDAAADWVLQNCHPHDRPEVLVTGAWADAEHGCAAAVAKTLATSGVTVRLSEHSPVSPDGSGERWAPADAVLHP